MAWNVDAVGAGAWHSIDSMSGLSKPCVHSADEVALVAVEVSVGKDIVEVEGDATVWDCGSFNFSHKVQAHVINNLLSD